MSVVATMNTSTPNVDAPTASMVAVARKQRIQDIVFHRLTQSFSLLVLILIFRPQGLLGRPLVAKV